LVPASPAEVEAALGATPADLGLDASALGEPDMTARAPEGGVILAWSDGSTTLWVRRTGSAGQAIGAFVKRPTGGRADAGDAEDAGLRVETVPGLGEEALVVDGAHVLETPGRALAATTAVLWLDAGREYRLEGTAPAERLVAVARSFGDG
jgi:enoyl-CoA hydratase/carnithine racemase